MFKRRNVESQSNPDTIDPGKVGNEGSNKHHPNISQTEICAVIRPLLASTASELEQPNQKDNLSSSAITLRKSILVVRGESDRHIQSHSNTNGGIGFEVQHSRHHDSVRSSPSMGRSYKQVFQPNISRPCSPTTQSTSTFQNTINYDNNVAINNEIFRQIRRESIFRNNKDDGNNSNIRSPAAKHRIPHDSKHLGGADKHCFFDKKSIKHIHVPPPVSKSSSSSSSSSESTIPPAPNGGYGWVIVFASFMIHFINDGVGFAFGVIYVALLEYFHSSKAQTALIISIYYSVPLLAGPVASILVDTYGCRKMTMLGGFISFLGFFSSIFVQKVEALYVTMGIVTGLGLSIVNVASIVIVAFYFDTKRAFATGISTSGSGIGATALGALVEIMLQHYGWRGTTLLFSGLFLNIVVFGALMRPVEWPENLAAERKKRKYQEKLNDFQEISKKPPGAMVSLLTGDLVNLEESQDNLEREQHSHVDRHHLLTHPSDRSPSSVYKSAKGGGGNSTSSDFDEDDERNKAHSTFDIPTYLTKNPVLVNETYETLHKDYNVDNLVQLLPLVHPDLYQIRSTPLEDGRTKHDPITLSSLPATPHAATTTHDDTLTDRPKHSQHSHSLVKRSDSQPHSHKDPHALWLEHVEKMRKAERYRFLRLNRSNITSKGCMLITPKYSIRASSCPDVYTSTLQRHDNEYSVRELLQELLDTIKSMCDFSMLKDMTYALFFISNFLLCLCDDIPHLYVVDRAIQLGTPPIKAALLLSMMGFINTIGQIIFGYLADRPSLNTIYLYTFATAGCGIACFGFVFLRTYWGLAGLSVLYGFLIAANYSLTSIILVDLMGLEEFTSSYGLILTAQGIGSLVGPPIGGLVSDLTHSYDSTFYLAGALILLSGLIMLVEPLFKNWKRQRKKDVSLMVREPVPVFPLIKDYKTNSLLTL